jgi:hypothetical protein
MLPWIFAVLLLLNLLLFAWGMLGETGGGRVLPPVPDGRYAIQLLTEVSELEAGPRAEGGEETGRAAFTVAPAPSIPSVPEGAAVRHTETALGRALVPAPDETDARPAIPTVRLTVDGEELPAGEDLPTVDSEGLPASETAGRPAAEEEQAQDPNGNESSAPAEDDPDPAEPAPDPPVRVPLPDPEPPVPGDEDAPREGAV